MFLLFDFAGTVSTMLFADDAVKLLRHRIVSIWEYVTAAIF